MLKRALRRLRTWAPPVSLGVIVGAGAFLMLERLDAPRNFAKTPATSSHIEQGVQTNPRAEPVRLAAAPPSHPYRNCAAARAAGDAPLHAGHPGYGAHLDRDGDGIACEPYLGR